MDLECLVRRQTNKSATDFYHFGYFVHRGCMWRIIFAYQRYNTMHQHNTFLIGWFITALLLGSAPISASADDTGIVPQPVSYTEKAGTYHIPAEGPEVKVSYGRIKGLPKNLPAYAKQSAYRMEINPKGVNVRAESETGAFYAIQSLKQLAQGAESIKCCTIVDYPEFSWRGLMLDVSRYYLDKDFVRKQIDAMAALKMNTLHMHLTDDAGWRLDIPDMPKLTELTAYRLGNGWDQWRAQGFRYASKDNPIASGGYLTVDDARALVSYAAERHITIVPEIDVPAHSDPLLAAFPQLRCQTPDGSPLQETHELCLSNPETYEVLYKILDEVMDIFSADYIHIGGDEASTAGWEQCPRCQKLMEDEGIEDISLFQTYFTKRIAEYVRSKGRTPLGWNEAETGMGTDEIALMAWHSPDEGRGIPKRGFKTVFSPNIRCYLDYVQDAPPTQPHPMGSYLPIDSVYAFNPLKGLSEAERANVLGVQANLWTEHIDTPAYAEYMLYPRTLAVAEIGWSGVQNTDSQEDFRARAKHFCATSLADYTSFDLDTEIGERPEYFTPVEHLAKGCKVTYTTPYSHRFTGSGEGTLTDGLLGGWSFETARWNGFDSDLDLTVDLGKKTSLSSVEATFMGNKSVWLALPENMEVYLSDDGSNWSKAGSAICQVNERDASMAYYPMRVQLEGDARYIRITAKRKTHSYCVWLFIDEIIVK